jgi:hypothetical protein
MPLAIMTLYTIQYLDMENEEHSTHTQSIAAQSCGEALEIAREYLKDKQGHICFFRAEDSVVLKEH